MNLSVLIMVSGCGMFSPQYFNGSPCLSCEISVLEVLSSLVCFVQIEALVSFHIFCVISSDGVVFCSTCVYLLVRSAFTCIAFPSGDVCLHVMAFDLLFIFCKIGSRLSSSFISPLFVIVRPKYLIFLTSFMFAV